MKNNLSHCVLSFMKQKTGNHTDDYRSIYDLLSMDLTADDVTFLKANILLPAPRDENDLKLALKYNINNADRILNFIKYKNKNELFFDSYYPIKIDESPDYYSCLFSYYINNPEIKKILCRNDQNNRQLQKMFRPFLTDADNFKLFIENQINTNAPIYKYSVPVYNESVWKKIGDDLLVDTLYLSYDDNINHLLKAYQNNVNDTLITLPDLIDKMFQNKGIDFYLSKRNSGRIKNMLLFGSGTKNEELFIQMINKNILDINDYIKIIINFKLYSPSIIKNIKFIDLQDKITNALQTYNMLSLKESIYDYMVKNLTGSIEIKNIDLEIL